ncbi:MAG: hypothetical protein ACRDBP_07530 [Luteolibacter sp.]
MRTALLLLLTAGTVSADLTDVSAPPPLRPLPVFKPVRPIAVAGFEAPVVLSASTLLGQDVAGPSHRVREFVPTDGYMAHFSIDSDFGDMQVVGTELARVRIHELAAIRKLLEVSRSDLFAEGVRRSLEQPVEAVKNIAKDPVGSVKAVPRTVGHFFQRIGRTVENAAANSRDRRERGEDSQIAEGIGHAARGIIGFESAKLECARQLGVDPYTDNERLQQEIERISWVFFSGGLPLRIGAAAISGGASVALTATKVVGLPDEIFSLTPSELAVRNQQDLTAMGVPEDMIRRYLSNEALSITLRVSIIRSLKALGSLPGSAAVAEVAANCETRRQVEFLNQALILLAKQQQSGKSKFSSLEVVGRLPGAIDAAGVLQISAPVDYVSWTPEVAEFAKREDLIGRKPTLLLGGGATERTWSELKALGWTLVTP